MSLTRYAPQILDAFRLIVARPKESAVLLLPGLALVAGGQLAAGQGGATAGIGLMLGMAAIAAMGFFWQRVLTAGQSGVEDLTPVQMVLRLALWLIILQLLQGFELAPTILMGMLLKDMPNSEVYTRTGIQVFQLLIGGLFLILPQLALGSWKDLAGTKLQEMVLSGGIAVGLGYVIINLPFIVLAEIAKGLFTDFAPNAGEAVVAAVLQVLHALNVVIMAGYMALVWNLLKDVPSRLSQAADPVQPGEPKVRRTTRINRTTKAKR